MADYELRRAAHDRRLYVIEGIGTLRLAGLFSRTAVAEADGVTWRLSRRGFWQREIDATDAEGHVVGRFEPRTLRRGGSLLWRGQELELRPSSSWREHYALGDGERELARLQGKSWGSPPVRLSVPDEISLDPGLLLFTAFVVRTLAADADTTAGAASTAATSG